MSSSGPGNMKLKIKPKIEQKLLPHNSSKYLLIILSSKFESAVSSVKEFLKKLKTKTASVGITSDNPILLFSGAKRRKIFYSRELLIKKTISQNKLNL